MPVPPTIFFEELRKLAQPIIQDHRFLCLDSRMGSPEYDAGLPENKIRHLVRKGVMIERNGFTVASNQLLSEVNHKSCSFPNTYSLRHG